MYSHPEIKYQPQHPMLKKQSTEYTIEEEGVFSSIANAAKSAAKSAANAAASAAGYALRKDVGKKLGKRWRAYYSRARALDAGQIAQNIEEKVRTELKAKLKELKAATGGKTLSYDDAQWCASGDNPNP